MSEAPIGRRNEFDAVVARLALPKPGVIAIAGPVGSGRTNMLRHLARAAEELGYQVIGSDEQPIMIEPTTTIANLRRRLQGSFADAETDEAVPASPVEGGSTLARAMDWFTSRLDDHQQIRELLGKMAPVVLFVDGYRAGAGFGTWFSGVLPPSLSDADTQIAIVLADSAERLEAFEHADLFITLGPLDADEVRRHLSAGAEGLSPPLTPDELDRYVEAAVDQPALVSALFDVFEASRFEMVDR